MGEYGSADDQELIEAIRQAAAALNHLAEVAGKPLVEHRAEKESTGGVITINRLDYPFTGVLVSFSGLPLRPLLVRRLVLTRIDHLRVPEGITAERPAGWIEYYDGEALPDGCDLHLLLPASVDPSIGYLILKQVSAGGDEAPYIVKRILIQQAYTPLNEMSEKNEPSGS